MSTTHVPKSKVLIINTNWFMTFKQIVSSHYQYHMIHVNTVLEKFRLELLKYYTHCV
jgi:hypothetical protein